MASALDAGADTGVEVARDRLMAKPRDGQPLVAEGGQGLAAARTSRQVGVEPLALR